MISKVSRGTGPRIAAVLAGLVTLTWLALPTGAWADTSQSNTRTVNSISTQLPGTTTTSGGGVAIAGPAVATNIPIVIQENVQVDASGNPNNVQNASNVATIGQSTGAASGDASGTNGGMAVTGGTVATSLAVVLQVNIQVIAGQTPAGGVTQNASNTAGIDQVTLASTGSSDATGGGSSASSGGAVATNTAVVSQFNTQVYVGGLGAGLAGSVQQDAANSGTLSQGVLAASGNTSATGSGSAASGNAWGNMSALLNQLNFQTAN